MYKENLLDRCIQLYGEVDGTKLHKAMATIADKDFCVSTGLDAHTISISRSCISRGHSFKLSEDYKYLVMPNNILYAVKSLTRKDIYHLLPWNVRAPSHPHCFVDDPIRSGFDMSSLC